MGPASQAVPPTQLYSPHVFTVVKLSVLRPPLPPVPQSQQVCAAGRTATRWQLACPVILAVPRRTAAIRAAEFGAQVLPSCTWSFDHGRDSTSERRVTFE